MRTVKLGALPCARATAEGGATRVEAGSGAVRRGQGSNLSNSRNHHKNSPVALAKGRASTRTVKLAPPCARATAEGGATRFEAGSGAVRTDKGSCLGIGFIYVFSISCAISRDWPMVARALASDKATEDLAPRSKATPAPIILIWVSRRYTRTVCVFR
jgi:hypothetical protein